MSNTAQRLLLCLTAGFVSLGAVSEDSAATETSYAIGSSTRFIHDESRPYDAVAGVNTGIRTLITELWYPADQSLIDASPDRFRHATYGDYVFGNRAMHRRMMTQTTFFHLTPDTVRKGISQTQIDAAIDELFSRKRESYVDAPLTSSPSKLPVVVMTHGDAGSRYNMETLCEYLAANGYVVIAPEHTGNSPYAMTGSDPALAAKGGDPDFRKAMAQVLPLLDDQGAYGSSENYGQSYTPLANAADPVKAIQKLDQSLVERLNDLRAALDELERMNRSGPFAGRLDLNRIGLTGRSFGGATTLIGLAMEPRFTAGFAVVPPGFSDQRGALPAEVLVPASRESVLLSAEGNSPFTHLNKPTFLLSGGEDALIIGLAAQQAKLAGAPGPSAENPHPLLRKIFESTSKAVVWGLLADSNHSTLGVSGGYWWPELKPDTSTRTFNPESTFTLIAPALAQQMQKEKALAFFDLTIRADRSALPRVLDQRYADQGLKLEARNF